MGKLDEIEMDLEIDTTLSSSESFISILFRTSIVFCQLSGSILCGKAR